LLAGADEPTVKASAHALGYDPERPHRVIVATGRPHDGLDEQFFQAVVREVRRLDVATLIVGRASSWIPRNSPRLELRLQVWPAGMAV
jgi:hypothetical protein